MTQPSMLVVDDEIGVRESLRLVFGKEFRISEASSSDDALRKVKVERPEVILLDILMPGTDGLETLKQVKSIDPETQVIMLTALNTARSAFSSKEHGAFDYVTKPFDVEEMRLRVSRALEKVQLSRELERLREEVGRRYGIENIIGRSERMLSIFKMVSLVASKKSTVLITGESGTGKELIARAIHYNSDLRGKDPGRHRVLFCLKFDKMIEKQRDIVLTISEWREMNGYHVKTVEEILTKATRLGKFP